MINIVIYSQNAGEKIIASLLDPETIGSQKVYLNSKPCSQHNGPLRPQCSQPRNILCSTQCDRSRRCASRQQCSSLARYRHQRRYQYYHGNQLRPRLFNNISIGNNCVLHTAATSPTGLGAELVLEGDNVIQNNCTLYSCRIGKGAYVGHNSVIMEGAILQAGAIIAPNSVVPPGRVVKERQVWGGNPIKYIRKAMEQ